MACASCTGVYGASCTVHCVQCIVYSMCTMYLVPSLAHILCHILCHIVRLCVACNSTLFVGRRLRILIKVRVQSLSENPISGDSALYRVYTESLESLVVSTESLRPAYTLVDILALATHYRLVIATSGLSRNDQNFLYTLACGTRLVSPVYSCTGGLDCP